MPQHIYTKYPLKPICYKCMLTTTLGIRFNLPITIKRSITRQTLIFSRCYRKQRLFLKMVCKRQQTSALTSRVIVNSCCVFIERAKPSCCDQTYILIEQMAGVAPGSSICLKVMADKLIKETKIQCPRLVQLLVIYGGPPRADLQPQLAFKFSIVSL